MRTEFKGWLVTGLNFLIVFVALLLGGLQLWSWMSRGPALIEATVPDNWIDESSQGLLIGPDDAALRIVEFMDFQCPACAAWWTRVDSLMTRHPGNVQVSLHHFPLVDIHPWALDAAMAVECAEQQGRFREFAGLMFANQALLGLKAWEAFAQDAGVVDLPEFLSCLSRPLEAFPRIAYGEALARRTGVRSTPTVWINGVLPRPRPALEQLEQLLASWSTPQP